MSSKGKYDSSNTMKIGIAWYFCHTRLEFRAHLNSEPVVRLWTDYERLNQTHFWSETAKLWWSSKNHSQIMNYDDSYTDFANHVSCDGYKRLRNIEPKDGTSCICVGPCLLPINYWYTFDAHWSIFKFINDILGIGRFSSFSNRRLLSYCLEHMIYVERPTNGYRRYHIVLGRRDSMVWDFMSRRPPPVRNHVVLMKDGP